MATRKISWGDICLGTQASRTWNNQYANTIVPGIKAGVLKAEELKDNEVELHDDGSITVFVEAKWGLRVVSMEIPASDWDWNLGCGN